MSNCVKDIGANRFIKFDRKEGEQKILHPVELYIYICLEIEGNAVECGSRAS